MGDFNINLLNYTKHNNTKDFLDVMFSHFLYPVITRPTRITEYSATLIDNIFCNNLNKNSLTSGLLYTDISDHVPIFSIIDRSKNLNGTSENLFHRPLTQSGKVKFRHKVQTIDFSFVQNSDSVAVVFTKFHKILAAAYNECFP